MKRIILVSLSLFILLVIVFAWVPAQSAPAHLEDAAERLNLSGRNQDHGWQVCRVGGIVDIFGVGLRQEFDLCNSDGTIISAYCLDPNLPVPSMGVLCSRVSPGSNEIWCGDNVQRLYQFALLQTAAPSSTPTPTITATPTSTSTATVTQTSAPTQTITPGGTTTLTATPNRTLTALPQIEETPTPFITPTTYRRPRAGGPGNLEVGFVLITLVGLLTAGSWWALKARARSGA